MTDVPENIFLLADCPHDWLFPQCAAVVQSSYMASWESILGFTLQIVPLCASMFLELLKPVPSGNNISNFGATNLLTGAPWGCGDNSCRSQSCGTSFLSFTGPHSLRLYMLSISSKLGSHWPIFNCVNDLVIFHPVCKCKSILKYLQKVEAVIFIFTCTYDMDHSGHMPDYPDQYCITLVCPWILGCS